MLQTLNSSNRINQQRNNSENSLSINPEFDFDEDEALKIYYAILKLSGKEYFSLSILQKTYCKLCREIFKDEIGTFT
jgi:hypothetical protein